MFLVKVRHIYRRYSDIPNRLFTKNHEWLKIISANNAKTNVESDYYNAQIGITEYSQKALGDIVFVDMPKVNSKYHLDGNK